MRGEGRERNGKAGGREGREEGGREGEEGGRKRGWTDLTSRAPEISVLNVLRQGCDVAVKTSHVKQVYTCVCMLWNCIGL